MEFKHKPVLLWECIEVLKIKDDGKYVDGTLGGAGHSKEILNDYYSLQKIKYKIAEYSLIKDEQINYSKLWDEYLIYAVAFGIPIQIVNKLKETNQEDKDIEYLANELAFYLSRKKIGLGGAF